MTKLTMLLARNRRAHRAARTTLRTIAIASALLILVLAWCDGRALAAGCAATSCKVVPCSTSLSATDGYQHTPDDAMAAGRDLPEGCDPSMSKIP